MFKRELTKVVMDNVTFNGVKDMAYKAGFTKGWWSGALVTSFLAIFIAANSKSQKNDNYTRIHDDEVVYESSED